MVIWDYKNSPFLSKFNPLVKEQRYGADLFYFARGINQIWLLINFLMISELIIIEHS